MYKVAEKSGHASPSHLLRIAHLRVASMESLKRWAKRVVKAPEHEIPTISTRDVLKGYEKNPAPLVRWIHFLKPQNQLPTHPIGRWILQVTLPNNQMGSQLQCGMALRRLHRRSDSWNGTGPPRDVIC